MHACDYFASYFCPNVLTMLPNIIHEGCKIEHY